MPEIDLSEIDMRRIFGHVLVFDSGVGGLTIAGELSDMAPALSIDYAADTGFFPYGDKSDDELRRRLPKVAKALYDHVQPDVFVIACNTASTLALEEVRTALPCPVVGTVPAIKPAAAHSQSGTIGLLATPGTIRRTYTDQLISEFAADVTVIKHGSLDLVELAEAVARGETPDLAHFKAAQAALFDAAGGEGIDTIVLACTHFPLVRDQLVESAPREVCYIDSGEAIARQTLRQLAQIGRPTRSDLGGRAFITDAAEQSGALISVFERFGYAPTVTVQVDDEPAVGKRV
jgi:glutamate racemase